MERPSGGGGGKDKIDAPGRLLKDNKQRFSLVEENGQLLIRANQGHTVTTVESESLLKPIQLKKFQCVLDSILETGLKCVKRLHVHFSCGLPTDGEVISCKIP